MFYDETQCDPNEMSHRATVCVFLEVCCMSLNEFKGSSYHELVEELQPFRRLPPAPVKAADFERTLPDQQGKAPSQETQEGE